MVKDDLKKFSLHYFLDDNSHSMDARVRNQCEAHFLTLAYEAIEILGFDLQIEAEASSESGRKNWPIYQVLWKRLLRIRALYIDKE